MRLILGLTGVGVSVSLSLQLNQATDAKRKTNDLINLIFIVFI
jgi:hypothetical protein